METRKSNNEDMIFSLKQKRSNKPLMEKRRRERINRSLNSLKELVLVAENKDMSKFNKLEKADILEMTVRHLKSLHEKLSSPDRSKELFDRYRTGFECCIAELDTFARSHDSVISSSCLPKVTSHLKSVCKKLAKDSPILLSSGGVVHRVKATIDSSVLKADVLRHESSSSSHSPGSSPGDSVPHVPTSVKSEAQSLAVCFPSGWNGVSSPHSFPPSPPDSSRCSSSPDSLRGSPMFELSNSQQSFLTPPSAMFLHLETRKNSIRTLSTTSHNTPLNLTIPHCSSNDPASSPSSVSASTSYCPLLIESSKCATAGSDTSVDSSLAKDVKSESSCTAEEELISKRSLNNYTPKSILLSRSVASSSDKVRCAPYPKKDAVKRYQRQNSSNSQQMPQDMPNSSCWRPW